MWIPGKRLFEKAVHGLGHVVEKAGVCVEKITGYRAGTKLENIGFNMRFASFDSSNATSSEKADKMAEMQKIYKEVEEKITPEIDEEIKNAVKILKEIENKLFRFISPDRLTKISTDDFKEIKENCLSYIGEKISLSNEEFSDLHKISSDKERNEKINTYKDETLKFLSNSLNEEINAKFKELAKSIIDEIDHEIELKEQILQEYIEELNDITNHKLDNSDFISKRVVDITYLECLLSSINNKLF